MIGARPTALALTDRLAAALRTRRVPRGPVAARLVLAGHVAAHAWATRGAPGRARRALAQLALLEVGRHLLGGQGVVQDGAALFPLFLLPDLHGPHFDPALQRLLLPGRGPFVAHLAVTGACPSRCTYCYAHAGGPDPPDLGDAALREVADGLAAAGVPLVILSGGEPLSRFERLLSLAERLAPGAEVRVATSGVGLTAARARRLASAGVKVIAVSLDGPDRAPVDAARGYAGAFDAAVRALRCAADAGLVTFATTVVGPDTFPTDGDVERFLAFVAGVHPRALVNFLPRFEAGRAATTGGFGAPADYAPIAARIARVITAGGHRATVFHAPLELLMGCLGGGLRQLQVDVRGRVAACISGAAVGDVRETPFATLYERFRAGPGRLKRGFLCAEVGATLAPGEALSPEATARALAAFDAAHEDSVFQRLLDLSPRALQWLVGPDASGP